LHDPIDVVWLVTLDRAAVVNNTKQLVESMLRSTAYTKGNSPCESFQNP
jgi:hypothetical protein